MQVHALEVQEDVNRVLFAVAPAGAGAGAAANGRPAKAGGPARSGGGKGRDSKLETKLRQQVLADGSRDDTAADIVDMLDNLHVC